MLGSILGQREYICYWHGVGVLTYDGDARAGTNVLCIALGEAAPSERVGNIEIRFVPYQKDPRIVARYY